MRKGYLLRLTFCIAMLLPPTASAQATPIAVTEGPVATELPISPAEWARLALLGLLTVVFSITRTENGSRDKDRLYGTRETAQ